MKSLQALANRALFVYENEAKEGGSKFGIVPSNAVGDQVKRPDILVFDLPTERNVPFNIVIEIIHTMPYPPVTQPAHVTDALDAAERLGVPLLRKDREQLKAANPIWGLSLGGQRKNREMGKVFCFGLSGDSSMLSELELVSICCPFVTGDTNVLFCFQFNEETREWEYNTDGDSVFTANVRGGREREKKNGWKERGA